MRADDERALRSRLADIERHLAQMPPHNASGAKDDLERQRAELQRRLAAARSTAQPRNDGGDRSVRQRKSTIVSSSAVEVVDPRAEAVRAPAAGTPPPPTGAFRRTTHIAAGPAEGHDYGDGVEVPRDLHGGCRDLTPTGEVDRASVTGHLAVDRTLTDLRLGDGTVPTGLVGKPALPGFRALVDAEVADTTTAAAAVLLDIGIGGTLAAYGRMQAGRQAGKSTSQVHSADVAERLGDSCRGWAKDGDVVAFVRSGDTRQPTLPPAVPEDDLDQWHDLGALPPWWVRRRRRIDVVEDESGTRILAAFRDSWVDADGIQRSLHEWELEVRADASGTVTHAEAVARSLPFTVCPHVADDVPGLVGSDLLDLRQRTRDVLGGPVGCTHLTDLLSTIPTAVRAARRDRA